jgi:hypothetical protein
MDSPALQNPLSPSVESTLPQARFQDAAEHDLNRHDVNVYIREEGEQQRIWTEHFNHGPSSIEQFLADCVPNAAPPYVVPSPTPFEDVISNSVEKMRGPLVNLELC